MSARPGLLRADRLALASLQESLREARERGDEQPAFTLIATCLDELGVGLPERGSGPLSLRHAKDEWLRRLRSADRSESTLAAYRTALTDLIDFLDRTGRDRTVFAEETIVAYLDDYRRRARPAQATYYRRFTVLRYFFRWLSQRADAPDPFRDLETPSKPRQEADWLTQDEFRRLLDAAGSPVRRRPGLAERDRLVLLALVATGIRRSELLALDWRDLDLDGERPSLLVRRGKGGKPRRQPLPPVLARELEHLRATRRPEANAPVVCGLEGKRLQPGILGLIIRRASKRAGLEKRVTAHTLRHTAATWLRQETGDARLVAAYLGHADLSTVSRYAHVAPDELHEAAATIVACAGLEAPSGPLERRRPGRDEDHLRTLPRNDPSKEASPGSTAWSNSDGGDVASAA